MAMPLEQLSSCRHRPVRALCIQYMAGMIHVFSCPFTSVRVSVHDNARPCLSVLYLPDFQAILIRFPDMQRRWQQQAGTRHTGS